MGFLLTHIDGCVAPLLKPTLAAEGIPDHKADEYPDDRNDYKWNVGPLLGESHCDPQHKPYAPKDVDNSVVDPPPNYDIG